MSMVFDDGEAEERIISCVEQAPVQVLAPLIDIDLQELIKRLAKDGIIVGDPAMSINELAEFHNSEPDDIIQLLFE